MSFQKCALLSLLPALLFAQEPSPMQSIGQAPPAEQSKQSHFPGAGRFPFDTAVTYRDRSGWTKVDFQGTSLAPQAKGNANVRSQSGYMQGEGRCEEPSVCPEFWRTPS